MLTFQVFPIRRIAELELVDVRMFQEGGLFYLSLKLYPVVEWPVFNSRRSNVIRLECFYFLNVCYKLFEVMHRQWLLLLFIIPGGEKQLQKNH